MTDQKITKQEEKFINNLLSGNKGIISSTLLEIRDEGTISLLPFLIELMHATKDDDVKKEVFNLLCELKMPAAVPVLIDAIRNEKYASIKETLIRTCWENGLDYSDYLEFFIDILIGSDFMCSFEAFTLIENMESDLDPVVVQLMVNKLQNALPQATVDKKPLLFDLITILPTIRKN